MKARAAVYVVVALAALAPRVGPALRGYHHSPDAAEYVLLARALARGEGFRLPVRVRFPAAEPLVHDAYPERAPLWPWLLSAPVRAGVGGVGWPDPRLQLLPVALAVCAAWGAASLGGVVARRRGLRGRRVVWVMLLSGWIAGWYPSGVRASVHLWAEALGWALAVWTARAAWSARGISGGVGVGALAAVVRFARPEAWVLTPLVVVWLGRARGGRVACAAAAGASVVQALGIWGTGVLAPQLFLLSVPWYETASQVGPVPVATWGEVAGGIARNLWHQVRHVLLPKNGFVVGVVAGWSRSSLWVWVGAWVAATAGVWSTDDPHRFTIVPFTWLGVLAAVEVEARWPRRRVRAAWGVGIVLVLGHAAGRELRGRAPRPAPEVVEGEVWVADPGAYALVTGRPARLRGSE